MGSCKDNMKETKEQSRSMAETKSLLGKVKGWRRPIKKREESAQTFADHISDAHTKLGDLIRIKVQDLSAEKGQEQYNQEALARLQTMNFHLESVMDLISEYAES